MNSLEKTKELNVNDLIKGLTESQTVMNYAFAGFKTEVETKFNEVNTRIDEHDTMIKKRIQITCTTKGYLKVVLQSIKMISILGIL